MPLDLDGSDARAEGADVEPLDLDAGAVRTRGLTKRFGHVVAVDGIDLDVAAGDRYGFLGPNGSGKTTTVRMLLGLVLPTAGSVRLLGHAVPGGLARALPQVGALVEGPAAYGHLSARANLRLLDAAAPGSVRAPGSLSSSRTRRARVDEALEAVGLAGVGRRRVAGFSLGMRQRLGLAAAIVRRPALLVLDEPTNGLDPQGIRLVSDLLLRLNAEGTTLFVSSHLLSEVESLCTRVGVMDRGRLVVQDDVAALRTPTGRVLLRVDDAAAAVAVLGRRVVGRAGEALVVEAGGGSGHGGAGAPTGSGAGAPTGSGAGTERHAAELVADLVRAGVGVREAVVERRTLTDLVLERTTAVGEG